MNRLEGKVAIITGANSGVGEATAIKFAAEGAKVAVIDLNAEWCAETVEAVAAAGSEAIALGCNVAVSQEVDGCVKEVLAKFGRVDIMVNNAGITRDAMFHKMTVDQAKKVMDVHFYGTFYCCQEVITGMRERAYGKIVKAPL